MCNIGLDIDGVLCNFAEGFLRAAKQLGLEDQFPKGWHDIHEYHISDRFEDVWQRVKRDPAFWLNLPVHAEYVAFPVTAYITARACPTELTAYWLAKHSFPYAPIFTVGEHGRKVPALKEARIDVYVEDDPTYYEEIVMAGGRCFLVDRPWNRTVEVYEPLGSRLVGDGPDGAYQLANMLGEIERRGWGGGGCDEKVVTRIEEKQGRAPSDSASADHSGQRLDQANTQGRRSAEPRDIASES